MSLRRPAATTVFASSVAITAATATASATASATAAAAAATTTAAAAAAAATIAAAAAAAAATIAAAAAARRPAPPRHGAGWGPEPPPPPTAPTPPPRPPPPPPPPPADLPLRIIFTARTHRQLEQSAAQLRRLPGAAGVRMALLGSRKQSCSLPRVRGAAGGANGASALQLACRRACAKGACPHYTALGREEHARALHARCCGGPEAAPYSLDDLAALAVGDAQEPGGEP